jgi:hypothetical protein
MGLDEDESGDRGKWELKPGDYVWTQCASCARLSRGPFGAGCAPFPGGIPQEITENRFDHRTPHPDEASPLRFAPSADVDPLALVALYRVLDGARKG